MVSKEQKFNWNKLKPWLQTELSDVRSYFKYTEGQLTYWFDEREKAKVRLEKIQEKLK